MCSFDLKRLCSQGFRSPSKRKIICSAHTFLQPISTPPSPVRRAGFTKLESSVVIDSNRDSEAQENTKKHEQRKQIRCLSTWKLHTLCPHICRSRFPTQSNAQRKVIREGARMVGQFLNTLYCKVHKYIFHTHPDDRHKSGTRCAWLLRGRQAIKTYGTEAKAYYQKKQHTKVVNIINSNEKYIS